jgi:hypothetical protein
MRPSTEAKSTLTAQQSSPARETLSAMQARSQAQESTHARRIRRWHRMDSTALANHTLKAPSQRELLDLVLGCATESSATFGEPEDALGRARAADDPRALARELLIDLAIRGWIEVRVRFADGGEGEVPRRRWEYEFAADRNWGVPIADCACYALTDRGHQHLIRSLQR